MEKKAIAFNSGPFGLNLAEARMIEHIYLLEVSSKYRRFLAFILTGILTGCTAHAAQNPPPPVTCTAPITVTVTGLSDANGYPLSVDKLQTNPPICACTDSTVKLCN